jgi:hypothetical protein
MRIRPHHTTHTRDAALSKLTRINRLILAGSVTLTGVLADVAAHAFPGKTLHSHSTSTTDASDQHSRNAKAHDPSSSSGSLHPPAEAPQPSGQATSESPPAERPAPTIASQSSTAAPAQEPSGSESSATPSAAPESPPAHESTPEATHESAPAQEPAPAHEEPPPVVSGGS